MTARDEAIRHLLEKKSNVNSPSFLRGSMKRFSFALTIVIINTISGIYFLLMALIVSNTCGLILDINWFVFGLEGIMEDRNIPPSQINGNENAMTFGQIMPILLLSSIVLVFREAYDGLYLQIAGKKNKQLKLIRTIEKDARGPALSLQFLPTQPRLYRRFHGGISKSIELF